MNTVNIIVFYFVVTQRCCSSIAVDEESDDPLNSFRICFESPVLVGTDVRLQCIVREPKNYTLTEL